MRYMSQLVICICVVAVFAVTALATGSERTSLSMLDADLVGTRALASLDFRDPGTAASLLQSSQNTYKLSMDSTMNAPAASYDYVNSDSSVQAEEGVQNLTADDINRRFKAHKAFESELMSNIEQESETDHELEHLMSHTGGDLQEWADKIGDQINDQEDSNDMDDESLVETDASTQPTSLLETSALTDAERSRWKRLRNKFKRFARRGGRKVHRVIRRIFGRKRHNHRHRHSRKRRNHRHRHSRKRHSRGRHSRRHRSRRHHSRRRHSRRRRSIFRKFGRKVVRKVGHKVRRALHRLFGRKRRSSRRRNHRRRRSSRRRIHRRRAVRYVPPSRRRPKDPNTPYYLDPVWSRETRKLYQANRIPGQPQDDRFDMPLPQLPPLTPPSAPSLTTEQRETNVAADLRATIESRLKSALPDVQVTNRTPGTADYIKQMDMDVNRNPGTLGSTATRKIANQIKLLHGVVQMSKNVTDGSVIEMIKERNKKGPSSTDVNLIELQSAPTAKDVVDCTACRFAWLSVENDVGTNLNAVTIYDSFVSHCSAMQNSNIFFYPCTQMFKQADIMIGNYMGGMSVNQVCMHASMCR